MKKVLIITGGLQFGGIQRFVVNIIKNAPLDEFQIDYLIFSGFGTDFKPEVEEKGGRVLVIDPPSSGYVNYVKNLGKILDDNKYDIVHSNTQFNSGINMWVAKKYGVPCRISHSHTTAHEHRVSRKQLLYEALMRNLIRRYSTVCLACGQQAGSWMYGNYPFQVIQNGIDTGAFLYSEENRVKIRDKYSIKYDDFLIGHSGTLLALKNQEMLIKLLPEIQKIKSNAKLILFGTGEKEITEHLKAETRRQHVQDSVIMAGAVKNVNECLSALDVFAFPSLREGTPLALIEAQSNGLPCIISNTIPKDAGITDLVTQLPLDDKPAWVKNICNASRMNPETYVQKVCEAGFDAKLAYESLYKIYRSENH